jgi:EpsD family peptidyl-prolyl cis-trans isomerase
MNRISPARTALIAVAVSLALAGCGKSDEKKPAAPVAAEKKPAGQAAARVNKEEISADQVKSMLARAGNVPEEEAKQASRQTLERLIDQELLVQQARAKKLDSDPRVVQAIDAATREILSRAYLEQAATAAAAKPSEQEIKDYYDKHPELFKSRRIYNLREIAINAKEDFMPALQAQMGKAKSLNDIVDWLKSNNVQFATNAGVKPAEQLPLDLLPKFHQLKDGQTAVIPTPSGLLVVQLVSSQSQPLDEKQAAQFIEQFLTNQKRTEAATGDLKKLREAAKIEYLGEFARAPEEKGKSVMEGADAAPAQTAPAASAMPPAHPPVAPAAAGGKAPAAK